MRILRVRRGYTTNSSGDSEWVPPPDPQYNKGQQPGAASAGGVTSHGNAPIFAVSPTAKHVTILATQTAASGTAQSQAAGAGQRADRSAGNLGLMGGLLAAVVLLFILTALLQRLLGGRE